MSRSVARRVQGTSEHISIVVACLFTEQSLGNVSIRDIWQPAGVLSPTLYHYC